MRSKVLATGLAVAAGIFGGCGEQGPEHVWRVGGEIGWVKLKDSGNNSNYSFKEGEECVMNRGAKLVLQDGKITYETEHEGGGTSCPDEVEVGISVRRAKAEDKQYRAFAEERQQVTTEVSSLEGVSATGSRQKAGGGWVHIVNPEPIRQRYSGIGGTPNHEYLTYGDECALNGQVEPIGNLSTSQTVMRVFYPEQLGTSCPTGTMYLDPPGPR